MQKKPFTERILDLFGSPLSEERKREIAVDASFLSTAPQSKLGWMVLLAHPFLLAVVPVLHLYSRNLFQALFPLMLIFVGLGLAMTAIVFLAAWLWFRDFVRTALFVSAFNLLFFAYGRVFDVVMRYEPTKLSYHAWHCILLVLMGGVLLLTGNALRHSKQNLLPLSRFLSVALAIMFVCCVGPIVRYEYRVAKDKLRGRVPPGYWYSMPARHNEPLNNDSPQTPDVYYIILDAYARADTLQRLLHFDNTPFLNFLRSRGFYVADQSCSNYPFTELSLASSLSMGYLDDLLPPENHNPDMNAIHARMDKGAVPSLFQSKGYRFVHFATNFKSSWSLADIVYRPQPAWLQNEFSQVLLRTTALRLLETNIAQQHLYEFDKVKSVATINGPTFTFCHVIAPHPPYVFDREGHIKRDVPQSMLVKDCGDRIPSDPVGRQAYIDQLVYVNKRVEEDIDAILARSPTRPIIIIQGDHGSYFTAPGIPTDEALDQFAPERLPILNAYYVPDKMRAKLYPSISPVNSFRLLFNECFGEHFEMLPERHMIGTYLDKFYLRDATAIVDPAATQKAPLVHASASTSRMLTSH